jgi:hypothetical protein
MRIPNDLIEIAMYSYALYEIMLATATSTPNEGYLLLENTYIVNILGLLQIVLRSSVCLIYASTEWYEYYRYSFLYTFDEEKAPFMKTISISKMNGWIINVLCLYKYRITGTSRTRDVVEIISACLHGVPIFRVVVVYREAIS